MSEKWFYRVSGVAKRGHSKSGATTEKPLFCTVEVREKGTWRIPCSVEWRERELRALSEGPQCSTRSAGARPIKERQTNVAILYSIRCLAEEPAQNTVHYSWRHGMPWDDLTTTVS